MYCEFGVASKKSAGIFLKHNPTRSWRKEEEHYKILETGKQAEELSDVSDLKKVGRANSQPIHSVESQRAEKLEAPGTSDRRSKAHR